MIEGNILVDTSCLIAYFKKEGQYEIVKSYLNPPYLASISCISLTEILKIIGNISKQEAYDIITYLENSEIGIVDVNKGIAKLAGSLKLEYKGLNLSTADCLVIATGIMQNSNFIITKDRGWKNVNEIKIEIM